MSKAIILTEAIEIRDARIRECNDVARKLMAECTPFMHRDAAQVIAGDTQRFMALAMDLADAQSKLTAAQGEYEALRRRQS